MDEGRGPPAPVSMQGLTDPVSLPVGVTDGAPVSEIVTAHARIEAEGVALVRMGGELTTWDEHIASGRHELELFASQSGSRATSGDLSTG